MFLQLDSSLLQETTVQCFRLKDKNNNILAET